MVFDRWYNVTNDIYVVITLGNCCKWHCWNGDNESKYFIVYLFLSIASYNQPPGVLVQMLHMTMTRPDCIRQALDSVDRQTLLTDKFK
jgi:hypothetical protein